MGLNTAGITALLEDGNDAVLYAAIGDGPTAADQVSDARQLITSTVTAGVVTAGGVPLAFTGANNADATHVLLFSAATAGTFYGFKALTGDQTFSADGDYQLTALTITGSSPA